MMPDSVTLIVKAPNQQIEDQNVECQTSWTVRQLKGHLSEVYPTKPSSGEVIRRDPDATVIIQITTAEKIAIATYDIDVANDSGSIKVYLGVTKQLQTTEEQKIIYSGQLLDDKTVLKDVLRTYESQIAHTMHLVCTPKRTVPEMQTNGCRKRIVQNAEPVQNAQTVQNAPSETEVPPVETTSRPEMRQNDQNHTVEMQNYLSSFVNNYGRVPPYPNYNIGEGYLPVSNDPALLANHVMMMQQAYLQYMQQYANMWQAPGVAQPAPTPEAPPAPPAAAPPAPPADDEEVNRDWLDNLYAASRLAILFSLVYLYGSPARLLLVLLLVAAGYLHQIGFFRDLQVNPAQNAPQNAPREPNNDPREPNAAQNEPNNAANNENVNVTTENVNDNQQSLLAVTWMIFSTFFASLIPDTN